MMIRTAQSTRQRLRTFRLFLLLVFLLPAGSTQLDAQEDGDARYAIVLTECCCPVSWATPPVEIARRSVPDHERTEIYRKDDSIQIEMAK